MKIFKTGFILLLLIPFKSTLANSNLNIDKIEEEIHRNFNIPSALYPKATKPIKRTDIKNSQTAMYTIVQTGRYYLDNDAIVSPSNNSSTIITVNASNTVIDLNGMVISQAHNNSATNLDAILVNTNVSNILIMNGSINSLSGIGVKANSGANNIVLMNVKINACANYGLNFSSTNNITFINCSFTNCDASGATSTDGAVGAHLSSCTNIAIKDCTFSHNQEISTGKNGIGLNLSGCTDASIENCSASSNKGDSAMGFRIISSTRGVTFKNCTANYCEATANSGSASGFLLNASEANEFFNCRAAYNRRNSGTGVAAYGFNLGSSNFNNFYDCEAKLNSAAGDTGSCYGFYSTAGKGNLFKQCIATGNTGGNNSASKGAGFGIANTENSTVIESCKANYNNGGTGEGYGIIADATTARTVNCVISKNQLIGNTGTAKTYGYRDTVAAGTGTANLLAGNVAYGQGTVGSLGSSSNLTIGNNMNYAFLFTTGDLASDYSADKTISELKIGGVGEMGRVSTSGNFGIIGFDNISLVD
jgi:hypothetical protein